MAIITISRDSYSKGKEIAEAVAQKLGYECVSREILMEASKDFHIPEIKLLRALHDAPAVIDRFTYGKEKYLAFIRSEFLGHARKDNMVYHGLAGHYMIEGIGHSLKVRIVADMEDRIRLEMQKENVSREEARRTLEKDDEARRKWSLAVWSKDPLDANLYDMILHLNKLSTEDVVHIIERTVKLEHFKTTPESQKAVEDLYLAAQVKTWIVGEFPNCTVSADGGTVRVYVTSELTLEPRIADEVKKLAEGVEGVRDVEVSVIPHGV